MAKILITPRSFGKYSKEAFRHLEEAGIQVVENPVGDILTEEEMVRNVSDIDGIIVGVDPLNRRVLEHAPKLKVVAKYGVGTDNIDQDYCQSHDIAVTVTRNANSQAVADYSFALLLAVARRVVEIDEGCHNEDWGKKIAADVYGKKIGVLGLGAIGRGVVERAKGFNMAVYGYDAYPDEEYLQKENVHFADIPTIIRECDFISIHLPLTEETKHLLNKDNLQDCKKNLIIINTARGGIISEDDLYELLQEKKILGAGVDVFEDEPAQNSKLLNVKNVVVGSHSAASTTGAVDSMSMMAAENIVNGLKEKGII